jgi:hypothetical protein
MSIPLTSVSRILAILLALIPCVLAAVETPTEADIARCVKTTKIVFKRKDDRNLRILDRYYAPEFRRLIGKGVASEPGQAPFLDSHFLRLTQDVLPKIAKVGPGSAKGERISVPVVLRYSPSIVNTNTAVFQHIGDRWMIGDLVSSFGSLRRELAKEFGSK